MVTRDTKPIPPPDVRNEVTGLVSLHMRTSLSRNETAKSFEAFDQCEPQRTVALSVDAEPLTFV